MPVPSEPYIDIVTGDTHGEIVEGEEFNWYNSQTTGSCTLSDYSSWCTMPNNVVGPDSSQPATAKDVTGNFGYSCPCHTGPAPVIVVHPVMPQNQRKTA
jgi:hypothetical protein